MMIERRHLLAWAFGVPVAAIATPASAQEPSYTDDFYRGRATMVMDMSASSLNDLTKLEPGDTVGAMSIVRSWGLFQRAIGSLEAPAKYAEAQSNLEDAMAHLVTAGEMIEAGIGASSTPIVSEAEAELEAYTELILSANKALRPER